MECFWNKFSNWNVIWKLQIKMSWCPTAMIEFLTHNTILFWKFWQKIKLYILCWSYPSTMIIQTLFFEAQRKIIPLLLSFFLIYFLSHCQMILSLDIIQLIKVCGKFLTLVPYCYLKTHPTMYRALPYKKKHPKILTFCTN